MSTILPNPVVMKIDYNIVSFTYQFIDLILFTSSTIRISLNDDTGVIRKQVAYTITGDEYSNWGGDDTYVINLIISKIPEWVNSE